MAALETIYSSCDTAAEIYNCRIDWRYLPEPEFDVQPHTAESGTHLADIAAGALYEAIDASKKHFRITDDRSMRNLRYSICRNKNEVYGLKFFPKEVPSILISRGNFDFDFVIRNGPPAHDLS
jgi:hypothetical protein